MTSAPPDDLLARFHPQVRRFETPAFTLRDDLLNLQRVQWVQAAEATILYCARILEALTACATEKVGLAAGTSTFLNLETLHQYNLLSTTARYCAHALRRLANQVRHVRQRVQPEDAGLAALFLERWLDWFFCQFRHGLGLAQVTLDGAPIGLAPANELRALLEAAEAFEASPQAIPSWSKLDRHNPVFKTAVLPALFSEIFLNRALYRDAQEVLAVGLACFPDDLRLCQLQGLYLKRIGETGQALQWMEPRYERYKDDEETAGIMAGIYKARWHETRSEVGWLEKAYRVYRHGWERSRQTNNYLGMNSAAALLWLGRAAESRQAAEHVRQVALARSAALARFAGESDLAFNFWDRVTLAEAHLLLGDLAEARCIYTDALAAHPDQRSSIEVTCTQLGEALAALGLADAPEQFLARPDATKERSVRVGVTGHRVMPADPAFRAQVAAALYTVRRPPDCGSVVPLVVLSSLADGADQLVADLVLAEPISGALEVVLPLEIDDYHHDFLAAGSDAEFLRLLNRACAIHFPPSPPRSERRAPASVSDDPHAKRNQAYERAGRRVVEMCDVLLALWDGEPARGQGGTADIVAFARDHGKPIVWIRTAPQYDRTDL